MHPLIEKFVKTAEEQQRKPAREAAKKHAAAIADIEKRRKPHQQRVDKMKAELTAARVWLANIPISAQPADIANNQAIVDRWPAMINEAQEPIGKLIQERRKCDTEYHYVLQHLDAEVQVEITQAVMDLRTTAPNIRRFVD